MIELYADCDRCRVQGAVIERCDPEVGETPVEAACGLCLRRWAMGEVIADGIELDDAEAVRIALGRWAQREGYGSTSEMVEANFLVEGEDALLAALAAGEPVETSFDVTGFLFGSGGGGGGGGVALVPEPVKDLRVAPRARIALPVPPGFHKKNAVLALASVMAADGQYAPAEQGFVVAAAQRREVKFSMSEARVYRPDEVGAVGPLTAREALIEEMVELAMVDGESDESELRVIETFARAWGVDPLRIRRALSQHGRRHEGVFTRVFRRVVLFLFPAPA